MSDPRKIIASYLDGQPDYVLAPAGIISALAAAGYVIVSIELSDETLEDVAEPTPDEVARLRDELGKAYRALRGYAGRVHNKRDIDGAMSAYHAPTVAAAIRFVENGSLDGSQYFVGKHVSILHDTLKKL